MFLSSILLLSFLCSKSYLFYKVRTLAASVLFAHTLRCWSLQVVSILVIAVSMIFISLWCGLVQKTLVCLVQIEVKSAALYVWVQAGSTTSFTKFIYVKTEVRVRSASPLEIQYIKYSPKFLFSSVRMFIYPQCPPNY